MLRHPFVKGKSYHQSSHFLKKTTWISGGTFLQMGATGAAAISAQDMMSLSKMPVARPKIISNEGALRIPLPGAQKIWFIYETWQKLGGPMTICSINVLL